MVDVRLPGVAVVVFGTARGRGGRLPGRGRQGAVYQISVVRRQPERPQAVERHHCVRHVPLVGLLGLSEGGTRTSKNDNNITLFRQTRHKTYVTPIPHKRTGPGLPVHYVVIRILGVELGSGVLCQRRCLHVVEEREPLELHTKGCLKADPHPRVEDESSCLGL